MAAAVPGVDVASHQGSPDWRAVHEDGFRFAYVKATEGVGFVSPTLDEQFAGARDSGLVVGLYHYARPDTNNPHRDAAEFAAQLDRLGAALPGNLPPCLDIEVRSPAEPGAWVKTFIEALRGHTGRHDVMVYSAASWFVDELDTADWIDPGVFLWVAHHGRPPGSPAYLTDRVVIHQHDPNGKVAGIDAATDLNVCLADLSVLAGGAVLPPPVPPDGDTYVVQPGDTLSGIGARLGIECSWLARVNGIADPDLIYVGERLRLPR